MTRIWTDDEVDELGGWCDCDDDAPRHPRIIVSSDDLWPVSDELRAIWRDRSAPAVERAVYLKAWTERIVRHAPPLNEEQRNAIAAILQRAPRLD